MTSLQDILDSLDNVVEKASACGAGAPGRPGFGQGNSCARGSGSGSGRSGGSGGGSKPLGGAKPKPSGGGTGKVAKIEAKIDTAFGKVMGKATKNLPKTKQEASSATKKILKSMGNKFKSAAGKIGKVALKVGKRLAKAAVKKAGKIVSKEMARIFGSRRMAATYIAMTSMMIGAGALGGAVAGSALGGGFLVGMGIALYQSGNAVLREMLSDV